MSFGNNALNFRRVLVNDFLKRLGVKSIKKYRTIWLPLFTILKKGCPTFTLTFFLYEKTMVMARCVLPAGCRARAGGAAGGWAARGDGGGGGCAAAWLLPPPAPPLAARARGSEQRPRSQGVLILSL